MGLAKMPSATTASGGGQSKGHHISLRAQRGGFMRSRGSPLRSSLQTSLPVFWWKRTAIAWKRLWARK